MQAVTLTQLAVIFLAGMAGSFHCVGMCGGFACALGRDPGGGRAATVVRHLLYNTGRVVSYMFLGTLAGLLGATLLAGHGAGLAVTGQRALAVLAGVLMILMALRLLGILQRLHAPVNVLVGQSVAAPLRGVLSAPGRGAPLAFGVFNGFLPCPLVYAFVALAAAGADPLRGALLMAVFGLGTFPAMLLTGALGGWLRYGWRLRGVRVAGAFILVLGVVTLARGILPLELHGLDDMLMHVGGHGH
jgi:uncharacterized protein